jgi:hypothetical protein
MVLGPLVVARLPSSRRLRAQRLGLDLQRLIRVLNLPSAPDSERRGFEATGDSRTPRPVPVAPSWSVSGAD